MFQVAAPTGQEMCPVWPQSSCAQQDLASQSDWPGSEFPFGEGARCSHPFPSHAVTLADWLGTVGVGRVLVGWIKHAASLFGVVSPIVSGSACFCAGSRICSAPIPACGHTCTCVPSVLTSVVAVDVPSLSFCSRWQISVLAIYIQG